MPWEWDGGEKGDAVVAMGMERGGGGGILCACSGSGMLSIL